MADVQVASTNIVTVGIATSHRFSVVPAFLIGQIDNYTAVALIGIVKLETYTRTNP
jgi:hypothetical protein